MCTNGLLSRADGVFAPYNESARQLPGLFNVPVVCHGNVEQQSTHRNTGAGLAKFVGHAHVTRLRRIGVPVTGIAPRRRPDHFSVAGNRRTHGPEQIVNHLTSFDAQCIAIVGRVRS